MARGKASKGEEKGWQGAMQGTGFGVVRQYQPYSVKARDKKQVGSGKERRAMLKFVVKSFV